MSERIACGFPLLHKISAGKCWQVLYLNIYTCIHIKTDIYTHISINIYTKGQNSLMVWKLDSKGTQGLCQGRAVCCLLGWGSEGHQWGADQVLGRSPTHPTAAELRVLLLSFWHHCRKPLMPPTDLSCPEITCKISFWLYIMSLAIVRWQNTGKWDHSHHMNCWNALLIPLLFAQAVRLKSQTQYHFLSYTSPYFPLLEKPNHHILCQVTFLKCCKRNEKQFLSFFRLVSWFLFHYTKILKPTG